MFNTDTGSEQCLIGVFMAGWMSIHEHCLQMMSCRVQCVCVCESVQYLMCVAGRLSYCRERKSSLWRSWCFCFSVSSVSVGFSFSSSNSSAKSTHSKITLNDIFKEMLLNGSCVPQKVKKNDTEDTTTVYL